MARSHQWIGLNCNAERWLKKHDAARSAAPHAMYDDAFGGEPTYPLGRWVLPNGRVVIEYVQVEPWSSGPMSYTALRYKDTGELVTESEWVLDEAVRDQEFDYETGRYWG